MRKIIWRSAIVLGVIWGAWWVVWEPLGLEQHFRAKRAAENDQIVIEQYAFSPGKCNFLYPCDRYRSFGALVDMFDSDIMNQYVPEETYGQTWALENLSTGKMLLFDNDSLEAAGIEPGTVLRVVRLDKGERN
jgi:hypothetical protein